jgi:hypothetical protein
VCVGSHECPFASSTPETCNCNDSWYLPQSLLSSRSPFLRAACTRDFKERSENRIALPDEEPVIFALFVEWLYYGEYTVPVLKFHDTNWTAAVNYHARCYVLGDKLLSTGFKNAAMSRLYNLYSRNSLFPSPVTTQDARYVWDNTAVGSKLRQFYLDYFAQHFANSLRLKGSTEEWDDLLMDYADARLILLKSFRASSEERGFVKAESEYLGADEPLGDCFGQLRIGRPAH